MRGIKLCVVLLIGALALAGCSALSKDEASVQNVVSTSTQPLVETPSSATAVVTDIQKKPVPEKPEVSRIVLTLDKKASYSTSREGTRLIINIFNAKMKSSIKQLDVKDPVMTSITTTQIGNGVKSVVELVNQDIAYRPSTTSNPFQIVVDVWQISAKTALQPPSSEGARTTVPTLTPGEDRTKDIVVGTEPATPASTSLSETPPGSNMPAQLEWFSEKLSQVLQEREGLKQQLLESEKSFAVKDSMIQVLERKVKEANIRIVELEEELIKMKSNLSVAEHDESAMRDELVRLITKLEQAAGEEVLITPTAPAVESLRQRSENLQGKVSVLRQESVVLGETQEEIDALNVQVAQLTAERDSLQQRVDRYVSEIASLKDMTSKFTAFEQELRLREVELSRLRQAIGQAAQLVTPSTGTRATQPAETSDMVSLPTVQGSESSQQPVAASEGQQDTQVQLAQLIQQQEWLPPGEQEYVLGPDDIMQIKVLKEENLDKTVTVSSDGFITFPLLGDLRVDGLTMAQVDAQITSLLARDFLVDPEVIVEVVKQRSKNVYIMGGVKQPGYHEIAGDQRLLGTLLSAGGPISFNTEARILRLPKGDMVGTEAVDTMSPMAVDLQALFVDGDQTQNVVLRDGDVIMVAEKKTGATGERPALGPDQFYVVGSVVNPGVYTYKQGDTALDAVLRAGGFTEFASRNGTKVVRESGGKTRTFQVRMKDVMEKGEMDKNVAITPGDMIIIPESFF